MRISIWQQFASNHSNSFSVVGIFENEGLAKAAYQMTHNILENIVQFKEFERSSKSDSSALTWPEIEYSRQYQVEWPEKTIDWLWSDTIVEGHVILYDRWVFVSNVLADTYFGARPFDELLKRLGGEVLKSEEMGDSSILADVACTLPDVDAGREFTDSLATYIDQVNKEQHVEVTPWRAHTAVFHQRSGATVFESFQDDLFWGRLKRVGMKLDLSLEFYRIGYGLPALIAYLVERNCSNIRYKLYQVSYLELERLRESQED